MSGKYSIAFVQEHCIQCHGCEVACKTWRNVELGVKWRRIDTSWHGHYPDSKNVPVMVACLHCIDSACVAVCPAGAIEKRASDGAVLVNRETCIGCKLCLKACPYHVPQFGADGKMQKCDLCLQDTTVACTSPPCVATCPTKALRLVSKLD